MYPHVVSPGGYEPSIVARQKPVRRGSNRDSDLVLEDSLDDGETLVGDGKAQILDKTSPHHTDLHLYARLPAPSGGQKKPVWLGGLSGPVSSNLTGRDRGRVVRAGCPKNANQSESSSCPFLLDKPPTLDLKNTSGLACSQERNTSTNRRHNQKNDSLLDNQPNIGGSVLASKTLDDILSADPNTRLKSATNTSERKQWETVTQQNDFPESRHLSLDTSESGNKRRERQLNNKSSVKDVESLFLAGKSNEKNKFGDLELGDIDDIEDEMNDLELCSRTPVLPPNFVVDSQPINIKTAMELKMLVFGSALKNFSREWHYQSFTFCDLPKLKYGLVQKKGGPCGIMASIQACLLQELLFANKHKPTQRDLEPNREERSRALASALSTILWRCGSGRKAVVTLPGMQAHFTNNSKIKTDNLIELITVNTLSSKEDLTIFLQQNIRQFELDGSSGVILALYSAILSRTVQGVREDMDEPTNTLMGSYGYCTQEMVNLFLTGHAASNVFNDVVELDSGTGDKTVLKGIQRRCDIGFLSLFEHYKSCQVGTYFKTPKFAIWVICSESHFSVLFSLKPDLLNDWKAERRFELYYYDGLAKQDMEIRLTIDTTNRMFQAPSEDELVPPLEHCIRTKWPDAEINWNGIEPLL